MTKLKKTIASIAACALMASALALNVSAANNLPFVTFADGTKAYSTLEHTSTTATATTSLSAAGGSVSVTIIGEYYIKGTSQTTKTSNANGAVTGTTAQISNGGGDWIKINSTHKASYGGSAVYNYLKWPE